VLRAKATTLSQKTSPQLVQSVVATTTRLRNATPLSTLWNYTCIPWDEDAPTKDAPTKVDNRLKHTSTIWQPQDVPTPPQRDGATQWHLFHLMAWHMTQATTWSSNTLLMIYSVTTTRWIVIWDFSFIIHLRDCNNWQFVFAALCLMFIDLCTI